MPHASALCLAAALALAQEPRDLRAGEPLVVELRVADARSVAEPAELSWTAQARGTVVVQASSAELRPVLRLMTASGDLLGESDDAGGTPFLVHDVAAGERLYVVVAGRDAGASGPVRIQLAAAVESDATLAAAAVARERMARASLARQRGDHEEARAEIAAGLAVLAEPPGAAESAEIQQASWELATESRRCSDYATAAAALESVRASWAQWFPSDSEPVQRVRQNLGALRFQLGDHAAARALFEELYAVAVRTQGPEDGRLLAACQGLAAIASQQGDLRRARELEEHVVEVYTRTLAADHPDLLFARLNLGLTLHQVGESATARALLEPTCESLARTLPLDDPRLRVARTNLSGVLRELGDLQRARALAEQVVEAASRSLPDDHPELQNARSNLALALARQGELASARALEEKVLAVYARSLPDDHIDLQRARLSLGTTLYRLDELEAARALQEKALAVVTDTLPPDDARVLLVREHLAATVYAMGDLEGARRLEEQALDGYARLMPDGDLRLEDARQHLAVTRWVTGDRAGALALARDIARGVRSRLSESVLELSPREAEEAAREASSAVSCVLCLGRGDSDAAAELSALGFDMAEAARVAGVRSARVAQLVGAGSAELDRLRRSLAERRADAARLALLSGASEAYLEAVREKERCERELAARLDSIGGSEVDARIGAAEIARVLGPDEAAVAYWRYECAEGSLARPWEAEPVVLALAFVVRPGAALARVELGPLDDIEAAVERWRHAILAPVERGLRPAERDTDPGRAEGEALRRLVIDPLLPHLHGARTVAVALDDPLHAVPLDALPEGDGVVGDRIALAIRSSLDELAHAREARVGGRLVVLGGVDYDSAPEEPVEALEASSGSLVAWTAGPEDAGAQAFVLRGGPWERGFLPLPESGAEVAAISLLYAKAFEDEARSPILLDERSASRAALEAAVRGARFLHLATHGYFAPESVLSSSDRRQLDTQAGVGLVPSAEERVRGLSPLVLCGLALSGANRPADALGRLPGLITAEELAGFELTGCELAVLSACDTNVGVRRAGQGVASLQKALHMAGARSVITSLWKVSDEAARELMVDFYRRIWIQGEPKSPALWEAKRRLRDKRDADGAPVHSTRDWAGWVLTGAPD